MTGLKDNCSSVLFLWYIRFMFQVSFLSLLKGEHRQEANNTALGSQDLPPENRSTGSILTPDASLE